MRTACYTCSGLFPALRELGDDTEASRGAEVAGLHVDQRAVRPGERIVLRQVRAAQPAALGVRAVLVLEHTILH